MRIMAMMSSVTGCLCVIAAVVGFFLRHPDTILLAGVGAGMTGLGEVAKAWQARNGS
jgi:hydroxyethylthiazole kinase-like sugar kinase family protein